MKYFINTPDNLAEMDYEEQRIAVLRAWEERIPAVEIYDPVNWITGKTNIPHKIYATPEAKDEQGKS